MMKLEITASAMAWYGAIVGTLSAIVASYNVLRDRAKLKIRITPNMEIAQKELYGDETYVLVTVSNAGRRPLSITHVWFERGKNDRPFLLADSLKQEGAKELTEGKHTDYLAMQKHLDPSIKKICIVDSIGKYHKRRVPRKVIESLKSK